MRVWDIFGDAQNDTQYTRLGMEFGLFRLVNREMRLIELLTVRTGGSQREDDEKSPTCQFIPDLPSSRTAHSRSTVLENVE